MTECVLDVEADAIVARRMDGSLLSRYSYTNIQDFTRVSDHEEAFLVDYVGRGRLFFCNKRGNLMSKVRTAAHILGLSWDHRDITMTQSKLKRAQYGSVETIGRTLVEFKVKKVTIKHKDPIPRILELHEYCLVEKDVSNLSAVSVRPWSSIFCLVRNHKIAQRLEIEYMDGDKRIYHSKDRDGVIAAIFDLCLSSGNGEVTLNSSPSQHGLRLLPRFAQEDCSESTTFFGDPSIATCFLKRIAAVGKWTAGGSHRAGVGTGRGLVYIAEEFNANVPCSGIQRNTKKHYIVDALKPLGTQLFNVSNSEPPAPRMSVTLLQTLYRIAPSYHGMREILSINGIVDSIIRFVLAQDELTTFWAIMLIKALTKNQESAGFARDIEGEVKNKAILFRNNDLMTSVVSLLEAVERGKIAPSDRSVSTPTRRVGPIVLMVVMETLEGALSSCRDSTGPTDFAFLVGLVAQKYDTLLRLLFHSKCATTVEACTLLVKTIVEECEPAMALSIKDAALAEGIVLRHLFQSIFDESADQRHVSRYLISLWMSRHTPARNLLKRIFPAGLVHFLDSQELVPTLDEDQLSPNAPNDTTVSPPAPIVTLVSPIQGQLEREQSRHSMDSYNSSSNSIDDDAHVTLQGRDYASSRLRQKIESANLDMDVQSTIESEPRDSHDSSRSLNSEQQPRASKKGGARGFIANIVRRRYIEASDVEFDERKKLDNFPMFFSQVQEDHRLPDLLWNDATRVELRAALFREMNDFDCQQEKSRGILIWNYHEFVVVYPSLTGITRIGDYYLDILLEYQERLVLNAEGPDAIRTPEVLMADLYQKLLKERGDAEHLGMTDMTLKCLRSMALLYTSHYSKIGRFFSDTLYFCYMIKTTMHSEILERLLDVLYALARQQPNAQLLIECDALGLIVDLLSMGHISCRRPDGENTKLWFIRCEGHVKGPVEVSDLKILDHNSYYELKSCDTVARYKSAALPDHWSEETEDGWQHMRDNTQLRWELCLSSTLSYLGISKTAMNILLYCASANSEFQENMLHTSQSTRRVYPIPRVNDILSSEKYVIHIVQSMILRDNEMTEAAAELLTILTAQNPNESAKAVLYTTGVFYFVWLYMGYNLLPLAQFLATCHSCQHIEWDHNAIKLNVGTVGMEVKDAESSILRRLLPSAMIHILDTFGPEKFCEVLAGQCTSPEVIWTPTMRKRLHRMIKEHLEDFPLCLQENVQSVYEFMPIPAVQYLELDDEYYCHNFYLAKLCDEEMFIDWPIPDPQEFMKDLVQHWCMENQRQRNPLTQEEALAVLGFSSLLEEGNDPEITLDQIRTAYRRCIRESFFVEGANPFHQATLDPELKEKFDTFDNAYEVLSAVREELLTDGSDPIIVLLLMKTQILLCKRYPQPLSPCEYEGYAMLVDILDSHRPEVYYRSMEQRLELLNAASELVYLTCLVSPQNSVSLIQAGGIPTLTALLNFCIQYIHRNDSSGSDFIGIATHVVKTLAGLVASSKARGVLEEESKFALDLCLVLQSHSTYNYTELTQYTLETISRMCHSSKLQDKLLHAGVIWQLNALILAEPISTEETDMILHMTIRALGRLGGYLSGDLASPPNPTARSVIEALYTPVLAARLSDPSGDLFHHVVSSATSVELITLQWTPGMHKELSTFNAAQIIDWLAAIEGGERTDLFSAVSAVEFLYDELKYKLYIGGVFLETLQKRFIDDTIPSTEELATIPPDFFPVVVQFIFSERSYNSASLFAGWGFEDENELTSHHIEHSLIALECLAHLAKHTVEAVEHAFSKPLGADLNGLSLLVGQIIHNDGKGPQTEDGLSTGQHFSLLILDELSRRQGCADTLIASQLIGPLIEHVQLHLLNQPLWSRILSIILNLCSFESVVVYMIRSRCILELLGWYSQVDDYVSEKEFEASEQIRLPSASIIAQMVHAPNCSRLVCDTLVQFLPISLRDAVMEAVDSSVEIFEADQETPEIVWNIYMRNQLRRDLGSLLNLARSRSIDESWQTEPPSKVDYSGVCKLLRVGNVYLKLYLVQPLFHLRYPKYFLMSLFNFFFQESTRKLEAYRAQGTDDQSEDEPLMLTTSCIVCVLRIYPWIFNDGDELTEYAASVGNMLKHCVSLADGGLVQISCIRLVHLLATSPRCVVFLAKQHVLQSLLACHEPGSSAMHPDGAFIFEAIHRVIKNYSDHGEQAAHQGVVAIAIRLDMISFLLDVVTRTKGGFTSLRHPQVARALAIDILNLLESDSQQGNLARSILKKNKPWEKGFKHEDTRLVLSKWEKESDYFFIGVASKADSLIKNHLATNPPLKATSETPPTTYRTEPVVRKTSSSSSNSPKASKSKDFKRLFR